MILLTVNEQKFQIADKWTDVTFGQYVDLLAIQQDTWEDLTKTVKIISALSDKPKELEEIINLMDFNDFTMLSEQMEWIKTDFVEVANQIELMNKFEIDGKEYKIKEQYQKLTLGEMITVETMLKDPNYNPQEIILAVLLREVIDGKEKAFNEDDFFYILNVLKYKINLVDVYKYLAFFLSGDKTSTGEISKGFSIQKI